MSNTFTSTSNAVTGGPAATIPVTKRRKTADDHHDLQPLLPPLPDDIALLCLSHLHPSILYSVCRSWRRIIYSNLFPPFPSLYALLSSDQMDSKNSLQFVTFDPISSTWHLLPPPPRDPPLHLIVRHRSFLSRNLPVQSVSVDGNLVLIAGTDYDFSPALPRPLVFNPISQRWTLGPTFTVPRRWCAAGSVGGSCYVASGIGSQFSADVARTVEKWDLRGESFIWEKLNGLRDGRFSRDAIEAVGCRGKICMVNMKGEGPKEGVVYNVGRDLWEEMPKGMIGGWRGPVAAMDEDVMYGVEVRKGTLRRYDERRDDWEEVMESERLRGAEQMVAGGGRVCVICSGGGGVVVVDVVNLPARSWVVAPPWGYDVLAVHVLPRMSHRSDFGFSESDSIRATE